MTDYKLSQSGLKDWLADDLCLHQWKLKHIDHAEQPYNDTFNKGHYFEYLLINETSKNGEAPKPQYLKDGVTMTKEYRDLTQSAEEAKRIWSELGIEIDCVGCRMEHGNTKGLFDVVATWNDRKCIIDVKYTETKETDWRNGWGNPSEKVEAHIQARHYVKLYHDVHGEWLPFFFFVFGKSGWIKIIKCNVAVDSMEQHQDMIDGFFPGLRAAESEGFPALPKFNKCRSCPFFESCEHKATLPEIETIEI